jgi:hypothetical protein
MPDERELWFRLGSQIVGNPEDDDLRYDFASELERGEPEGSPNRARAEFIRIQLTLSTLDPGHAEYMRLATRAYDLELRYREEEQWVPGLFRDLPSPKAEFHRGFVELITVPAGTLRQRQNDLFAAAPLEHLDISKLEGEQDLLYLLASLAENDHLRKLVSLGLDGQRLTDESISILSGAPFDRLQWLSLAHNQIGQRGVDLLVTGRLRNLRFVSLRDNLYDPTTELFYDQGIVIERRENRRYADLTEIPWLTKTVRGGRYVQPDRFAVNS